MGNMAFEVPDSRTLRRELARAVGLDARRAAAAADWLLREWRDHDVLAAALNPLACTAKVTAGCWSQGLARAR